MALAIDSSSKGNVNPGTSITFAHTNTGSDLVLPVGVRTETILDLISTVAYAGVNATRIILRANVSATESFYGYMKLAPATGANNIVVTAASSISMSAGATSFTGADQTTNPENSNFVEGNPANSLNPTLTVGLANCWLWGFAGWAAGGTITGGAGTTIRQQDLLFGNGYGDSNGTVSTGTQGLVFDSTTTSNSTGIIFSIAPVAGSAAVGTALRTLMGVGT